VFPDNWGGIKGMAVAVAGPKPDHFSNLRGEITTLEEEEGRATKGGAL